MNISRFSLEACRFLITAAVLLVGLSAAARTARVDSIDRLHEALEQARPGDTVVLADGTYRDAELRLHAVGTAEQPVTVRAQTVGGVKLTGDASLRLWGKHLIVEGLSFEDGFTENGDVIQFRRDQGDQEGDDAQDCRLTRCSIINFNPPDDTDGNKWVSIYGLRNRVDRCFFEGKNNDGAMLVVWLDGTPDHHRIDRNHFGHRPPLGRNGGETIRVGTSIWSQSTSATVVEHNLFDRCDGEIEVISNKSCENIYRNNTFDDCDGMLTIRHGARCLVENNVFLGRDRADRDGFEGSGGVRVIGPDHVVRNNHMQDLHGSGFRAALSIMNGIPDSPLNGYYRVERAVIENNVVIDCTHPLTLGTGFGSRNRVLPPLDCTLAGNLIVNRQRPGAIAALDEPENLEVRDNTIAGSPAPELLSTQTINDIPQLKKRDDGLWRPADEDPAASLRVLTPADVGPVAPAE